MAPPLVISLILAGAQLGLTLLTLPRNRNQQPLDVGKFDDVRITGSEYGSFIPRIYGRVRIGGNVIWATGIKHVVTDVPSQGGKGIPQAPAQRTHSYFTDCGIQFCRGEVLEFEKLWADADLISDRTSSGRNIFEAEDGTLAGTASLVDPDPTARGGKSVTGIGNQGAGTPGTLTFDLRTIPIPDAPPSEDDSELKDPVSRYEVYVKTDGTKEMFVEFTYDTFGGFPTVSNFTPVNTDGEWRIFTFEVAGFPDEIKFYNSTGPAPDLDLIKMSRYYYTGVNQVQSTTGYATGFKDPDLLADASALDNSGLFDFYPAADLDGMITGSLTIGGALRFYLGTQTQAKDPKHIAYMNQRYGSDVTTGGTSYTPAYRGTVVAVFDGLNLKQGRVPNFTVEVYNNKVNCNDVLETLCEDVGILPAEYDFTETDGLQFHGYIESKPESRRSHIENLERYFGFRIAEIGGKLVSILDKTENEYDPATNDPPLIDSDLLRAHLYGNEMPSSDYVLKFPDPLQLPKEVRFSVMNPQLEYHTEIVTAMIESGVSSSDARQFDFPIVANTEQARRRCEAMILKLHAESQVITFEAMPEFMRYTVGDQVTLELEGENRTVRIERIQSQMPVGVVQVEGVITDNVFYSELELETAVQSTTVSQISSEQFASVPIPRVGKVVPIISEPIFDTERGRLGVYVGIANAGIGSSQGTGLFREYGTDNFLLEKYAESPTVMGEAVAALGNWATPSTEDTTNTVDILFYDDVSLESVTGGDLDARPALNLIRIGSEWLQFRTAVVQSLDKTSPYRSKWRLSNLRRGKFGTAAAIGSHGAGEDAVFVTPSLYFLPLENADIGQSVVLKAVAGGQTLEDAPEVTFTFNPISKYSITNATDDRTLDANCTTLDELADVVATVIKDSKL